MLPERRESRRLFCGKPKDRTQNISNFVSEGGKEMKDKGMLGSIFSYAKPCKGKLTLSVICALISVAALFPLWQLIVLSLCFLIIPLP